MPETRGDRPGGSQDDAAAALARLADDEPRPREPQPPPPPPEDEPPLTASAPTPVRVAQSRTTTEAVWRKYALPPMVVMAVIMFLLGSWSILALLGHNLLTDEPDEAVDRLAKVMLLCWPVGLSMVAGVWFFRRQGRQRPS